MASVANPRKNTPKHAPANFAGVFNLQLLKNNITQTLVLAKKSRDDQFFFRLELYYNLFQPVFFSTRGTETEPIHKHVHTSLTEFRGYLSVFTMPWTSCIMRIAITGHITQVVAIRLFLTTSWWKGPFWKHSRMSSIRMWLKLVVRELVKLWTRWMNKLVKPNQILPSLTLRSGDPAPETCRVKVRLGQARLGNVRLG